MNRTVVSTSAAPAAIGPYCQAIRAGDFVFCSGQIALDPGGGGLVGGDAAGQARQVLENLAAVLRAAGAALGDVVKTTIYLTDMGAFAAVNEVYARYFGDAPPARATVAVSALPAGALVEMDAVALVRAAG